MVDISIVIPARDEENYIGNCLESIEAAKSISTLTFETIVVSDNSKDRTVELASKYDCIVYDENFCNRSKARNFGAYVSKGKYFLFIDADTTIDKHFFIQLKKSLLSNNKTYWFNQTSLENEFFADIYFKIISFISRIRPIQCPTILAERNYFFGIGGFDIKLKSLEDYFFLDKAYKNKLGTYSKALVLTSTRRFREYGILGCLKHNFLAIKNPNNFEWSVIKD